MMWASKVGTYDIDTGSGGDMMALTRRGGGGCEDRCPKECSQEYRPILCIPCSPWNPTDLFSIELIEMNV